ncbi:binding-protein-dependent transport systems inner membrane component [Parasphaerochaeta coccoides DSM 17374]|uniref:Oligopeptide transport system permease protein OppC n=1 Tax=Parasphaerochaeta coccoides (strain ATCC BAA-1237 / DSM 17374 / SPN1) TaxID=760011 RepID=F4GLL6_PARC1|nr:ABC transporter permease [Parasphaerochaeta coccoides]AEC02410.1 binding-protein-dependent transport systems inner membrane component [Parasphaerochaeta coccoides DSM 17374]
MSISNVFKNIVRSFSHRSGEDAVNEFDQVVMGNSLTKDAWRRLKKNKMAVIGLVVISLYALITIFADFLPFYPSDEIILEHQHLPPTLSHTAGDLMMEKKLKEVYFMAWKDGRLVVTDEESAQIRAWIDANDTNKVWNFSYAEGERQRAAGTFEFNNSERQSLERLQTQIDTDLQVRVEKIWWKDPATGKLHDIQGMSLAEMIGIYADLLKVDDKLIVAQLESEIRAQLINVIKTDSPDLTNEEYEILVDTELDVRSERELTQMEKDNIYGKLKTQSLRYAQNQLKTIVLDPEVVFPLTERFDVSSFLTAEVVASKKHERKYVFGTDHQGRDLLSRIVYGGRVSIAIGLVGTFTSVLIGIIVGALAGYLGGKVDYFLMRFVDIMYGLPYMLLVIIFMAIFGRNTMNLFVALALVSWLTIARMVRGQIMSLKNQEFIEAARSMGASTLRIIFYHLIPNSLSVIIVYSTLRIPAFVMQESFLSFLGLGIQAPASSWGSLLGDAVNGMTLYPWKMIFPAIAMTLFLFMMNFLGDGLRDAFDPQSKNQL